MTNPNPVTSGRVEFAPLPPSLLVLLVLTSSLLLSYHSLSMYKTHSSTSPSYQNPIFRSPKQYPLPQMASLSFLFFFLLLLILFHLSLSTPTSYASQSQNSELRSRRNIAIMEEEEEVDQSVSKLHSKKKLIFDSKNQIKPRNTNSTSILSSIFKSKLNKTLDSTLKPSNSTKLSKPIKLFKSNSTKIQLQSLNSTKPIKPIKSNSTNPSKTKLSSRKLTKTIKPTKPNSTIPAKIKLKSPNSTPKSQEKTQDSFYLEDQETDDENLISEFRDLPSRIHQAFLPDLEKISTTSKAYISRANREIEEGVKPFVGNKFAPKIASFASCFFLILPLLLVTALFHRLRSYLSLQRFLIFVQAYLAIYFATLSLTAVVTGLEPLKFFYATSPSSYAWTQAVQTLGYVLYLLVQLINLVVVFSAGDGEMGSKGLGLAQMLVGLAVGLHYYAAVFHRAVTGDPPRANWKIHGVYAACFLVICAFALAERRKKAYLQEGEGDGKKS